MKKLKFISGLAIVVLALGVTACKKEGCTDPLASNYDEKANDDDGSCIYDGVTPGTTVEVTENITTPTTWSSAVIKVCADINVSAALTIQPGVTVVFCADAGLSVIDAGSINAIGTATSPIVFKGEVETPGYWRGIGIATNNPNNQFNYVTVKDGGSYWFYEFANVCVYESGKLNISNSTISNSEEKGIWAGESTSFPVFTSNTFLDNAGTGLDITAKQVSALDEASSYNVGNGNNFINVRSANLSSNETWKNTTTPLLINGEVKIAAGLVLSAGMDIMFEASAQLTVEESGYLTAIGAAGNSITMRGRFSSAGYWRGIYIDSNNPNNKFAYVNFSDGGEYWFLDYSTVYVSGRLEMDNCSITNSNSWALIVGSSSTMIAGGATQTEPSGVEAYNTLTGNGTGPDADCVGGGCTVLFD